MEKIKVIVKIDENEDFIAFFPESSANKYNIECWQIMGEHGEASIDYFHDCKKPRKGKEAEVGKFMQIYENNYSGINDAYFKLERVYRLSRNQCQKIWIRAE